MSSLSESDTQRATAGLLIRGLRFSVGRTTVNSKVVLLGQPLKEESEAKEETELHRKKKSAHEGADEGGTAPQNPSAVLTNGDEQEKQGTAASEGAHNASVLSKPTQQLQMKECLTRARPEQGKQAQLAGQTARGRQVCRSSASLVYSAVEAMSGFQKA